MLNHVPIPDVERESWVKFVKNHITDKEIDGIRIGAFGLTIRRLCDLDLMKNPRQINLKGKTVWVADWIEPFTLGSFLTDKDLQYNTFCESMRQYSDNPQVINYQGAKIDNQFITLSGLLAITHRAGVDGLLSWVHKKKRFSKTNAAMKACNRIF